MRKQNSCFTQINEKNANITFALTVDMQTASGLNATQSIRHFAPVPPSIIRFSVLNRQRRLVVPEEHLVLAAWVHFTGVFEPVPTTSPDDQQRKEQKKNKNVLCTLR